MNEWMNECLKKEHVGRLELVEMRSPHPGCSTALGLPSFWSTANRPPGPGLFYPRDLDAEAWRRPVVVSPELCSCSCGHPEAEITGEQGTHIPPQDSRQGCCQSLRRHPAAVSCLLPWTWGGPSWLCPGPPPALSRGQRGLPGAPSSGSAPTTACLWLPGDLSP